MNTDKKEDKVLGDLDKTIDEKGKDFWDKWNERLAYAFEKIALMDQSNEGKEEISRTVVEDSKVDLLYWSQIVLSALIATLGLLQNSVAVVIGAMLLAPLFIPLQALAFAITEGKSSLFWRALGVIVASSILSVGIAMFVVLLVPLQVETSEILARVSPNIYDLFIAAFSAVIALLALVYKRLSQSVAGVAMAASLMPPLGVIGIQIGFGNIEKALGATLLYTTNIVAIILVGVLMFILYGFHPHKEKSYSVIARGMFLLVVTVGLSVPLVASIQAQQSRISLYNTVEDQLDNSLAVVIPSGEISELEVNGSPNEIEIGLDLRVPEEVTLFETDLQRFIDLVSTGLDREVNLNLDIIRTATLNKQIDDNQELEGMIGDFVRKTFAEYDGKVLVNYESLREEDNVRLRLVYALEDNEDFSDAEKEELLDDLFDEFEEVRFQLSWVPLNYVAEVDEDAESMEEDVREFLESQLAQGWYVIRSDVRRLDVEGEDLYDLNIWLSLPESAKEQISDNVIVDSEIERAINRYLNSQYTAEERPDYTYSYELSFREPSVRGGGL